MHTNVYNILNVKFLCSLLVGIKFNSIKPIILLLSVQCQQSYIESTGDSVCTMCSKPILPIHTLIKLKLTTTSHVSLKSAQTETTAVTTQLNQHNV